MLTVQAGISIQAHRCVVRDTNRCTVEAYALVHIAVVEL